MSTHPGVDVLSRYAAGAPDLDEAAVWSVEAHLEGCAPCRAALPTGGTQALLDRVTAGVDRGIAAGPAPERRPRWWSPQRRRWLVWSLLPWVTMTAAVLACAVALESLLPGLPSLVLLLAPVAPLPAVAVAWSRRADPAWELIAATPTAGLALLLRRAATVLALVVPVLAVAGLRTGASLALILLPSLAFSVASVALGALIGVHRAAAGLAAAWALAVVVPSLITESMPVVLRPGSAVVWAVIAAALAGLAVTRTVNHRGEI